MKLFDKAMKYVGKMKSRTFTAVLNTYNGVTQWADAKNEVYAKEGYEKNVYVYSAIRSVAKSVSSPHWDMYERPTDTKGDLKKIFGHPASNLMERPNPFESGVTFRTNLMTYLQIYGNAYIEEVSSRGEAPKGLYLLRPDRVSIDPAVVKSNKGVISHYIYTVNGVETYIPAEKILHIKYINPLDDFFGLSPVKAAGLAIDQNNLTKGWNIDILNNGGMPSGSLSTEHELSEEQFNDVSSQMAGYSADKRGSILVLEAGLKFERFSMSAEDMSWVHATKMSAREISIVFGVPPEILGDSTNKTYNNYTQARKAFYEETVIPTLDWIESELGYWLIKKFKLDPHKYIFSYNKEDIQAIQEDRMAIYEKANSSYFLTLNEKRNLVGFDDVENGEVYLVPNTLSVVKDLNEAIVNTEETEDVETDGGDDTNDGLPSE
jgi:HK97 family phage portal protein